MVRLIQIEAALQPVQSMISENIMSRWSFTKTLAILIMALVNLIEVQCRQWQDSSKSLFCPVLSVIWYLQPRCLTSHTLSVTLTSRKAHTFLQTILVVTNRQSILSVYLRLPHTTRSTKNSRSLRLLIKGSSELIQSQLKATSMCLTPTRSSLILDTQRARHSRSLSSLVRSRQLRPILCLISPMRS